MKTDRVLKSANLSLLVNFAYGIYNAVLGFVFHSGWFVALGVYFTVLSITRFSVLRVKKKAHNDPETEMFAKKFTGCMLMGISVTLAGTVVLSAIKDRGVRYNQIVMITVALYTFTKITLAVINLIKAKGNDSPVIKTLRSISLADAYVSVFSLQRSMLVSFEGMDAEQIRLFNILTGSAVSVLVFLSGLYLLTERRVKMAKSKIVKVGKKVSDTVVNGYKKVEKTVVDGYTKVEDKFVDAYLTREGETLEEAKKRLKNQNK